MRIRAWVAVCWLLGASWGVAQGSYSENFLNFSAGTPGQLFSFENLTNSYTGAGRWDYMGTQGVFR